jgi:hypothetical protein
MVVYLRYIARVDYAWEVALPWGIPVSTGASVLAGLFFTIGLWPAYSFGTPLLLFTLFMGALMLTHFIPFLP